MYIYVSSSVAQVDVMMMTAFIITLEEIMY